MHLPYSTHSEFFAPIQAAVDNAQRQLEKPIRIELKRGGYDREVIVEIFPDDPDSFWAEWESRQPSRFSARIKAAATVLKRAGLSGRYRISHEDGVMLIQRVS